MNPYELPYPLAIRRAALIIAVLLAVLIGYFSLVPPGDAPAPQISDKIRHFAAYAMLAVPVAITVDRCRRRWSMASAWWDHRASMPSCATVFPTSQW